jgi:hypothetical protein
VTAAFTNLFTAAAVYSPTLMSHRFWSACLALGTLLLSSTVLAQTASLPAARVVTATRTTGPPLVDGQLTEEAWALATPISGFTQRDPDEGKPATEDTEVRILYDDAAIYVGVRLFDHDPAGLARRLSARDNGFDADWVGVYLDPLHDHLTGAMFRVSAANVQQDMVLYNDSWTDSNWDAVWQSQVAIDELGWTAEIRIPLSQLRFTGADQQTWGINVERYVRRKNESSFLRMVPKNDSGLASKMLDLAGLDGLRPGRHLEWLPYTAGRTEFVQPAKAGSPFNDGSRAFASAGLDMKWGVTNNLTINATVNPDFGQVEVDPAVVNLTAFETFFQEKRSFFLEGSQIFNNFGQGGANDSWGFNNSEPNLFYSRRIGRAPQLSASGDYIDSPTATTILGAVKLTGKTHGNWSLGFLEAVTGEEHARIQNGLARTTALVEPMTNYSVARVQRDIGQRGGLGFLMTATNRELPNDQARDALVKQAYVVGADGYFFLDAAREWVINGRLSGSDVDGSTAVIDRLQRAPQRYYQRPDAPQVHLDPSRTSLRGYTGRVMLNRNSGIWRVNAALWGVSPGFESNDLGFHGTGDRAGMHAVWTLRNNTPGTVLRSRFIWVEKWYTWNFDRQLQSDGDQGSLQLQFLNYWNLNVNLGSNQESLNDRLTRGGPAALSPSGQFFNINGGTDSRQVVSLSAFGQMNRCDCISRNRSWGVTVNYKPSSRLTINTGPQWTRSRQAAQYVQTVADTTATDTYGNRYVFGELDQTQLTLQTRITTLLTPKMSVTLFAQPLMATGDYTHFKELAAPRTFDFNTYGDSPNRLLAFDPVANQYTASPDAAAGAPSFTFDNPDFNLKSLRVNAVFRWEIKPGSTFYAVWTRQQQDFANPGTFDLGRDLRSTFAARGDDVVLVKMAYWIGR